MLEEKNREAGELASQVLHLNQEMTEQGFVLNAAFQRARGSGKTGRGFFEKHAEKIAPVDSGVIC